MVGLSQGAEQKLQLMRDNYRQSLNAKKQEIDEAWADCAAAGWQASEAALLKTLVHKLAGSAGLYGFDELGAAARGLELGLQEVLHSAQAGEDQAFLASMRALEACFAAAQA